MTRIEKLLPQYIDPIPDWAHTSVSPTLTLFAPHPIRALDRALPSPPPLPPLSSFSFTSPISPPRAPKPRVHLHALLSLAAVGMRGPTLDELLAVLAPAGGAGATADDVAALAAHVVGRVLADASAAGGPLVSFANGVWVDASLSLKAMFAEITASTYKAEIQPVNFQTKGSQSTYQEISVAQRCITTLSS
ncbi:serpin-Z7-like [Ananas comosus]|uniref:Serpin-Z7-like n=1 Tax=Ananas comosus TaxID=4615 RepID=A0A6P5FGK5_ANACO|nr:serpin-Z7-like [Ananas comosus]